MKWILYGPHALLIRFESRPGDKAFAKARAVVAALEEHPPPGLLEFVSASTSVLLEFDPQVVTDLKQEAPGVVSSLKAAAGKKRLPPAVVKEVEVIYDGPDLERVAEGRHLSVEEVCRLHAAPVYQVYSLGFAPGFPCLGRLDRRLHTPRLDTPRKTVPAGSVAIGGEHTGIYTVDSPGAWNIIGHTPTPIFDPARLGPEGDERAMFLLHQGDQVRFVPRAKS